MADNADGKLMALAAQAVAMEVTLFDEDSVAPPRAPTYRVLQGRSPLVLSAPHSVRQPRRSSDAAQDLHRSEPYTGPLAIQLHRATGAWTIYATRTSRADPNHARASSYKNKGLLRLARCAHPYLIIDLHGSRSQDFTVAVGTAPAHRAGRAQPMIEYISARLAGLLGCDVLVDPPGFRANNPSTVTAHCWSALGIPTLQIEISRAFRRPRHDPAAYAMLFTAFSTLIGELCSHPVAAQ